MTRPDPRRGTAIAAIARLCAIADLDFEAIELLEAAAEKPTMLPARRELLTLGRKIPSPLLILDGWAARVQIVPDGRRQLISFVLPGDIVGNCGFESARAASTVVGLTAVTVCPLPQASTPRLERAYAISRALDEAHLMGQVVRLGRLDAADRLIDLLLELYDRLAPTCLSAGGRFELPLTQEVLADALGLTSVHVNRMVQQARKRGDLMWAGRTVQLNNVDELRCSLGGEVTQVT